jgi:DNA mismatch repair protein MutL
MSKIKVLADSLANMIAAGEVVERPASVVKELLENALDAGARTVNIEVESGGKKLIRVVDDGEGMTRDDAIVAFERHATSKLRTPDDLEAITTLGFRGEALPSIASVSRLCLRTKTGGDLEGTEVEFSGGKMVAVRDIAWPGGTEVEVRELFFNIPARRKFLKSDATESYHITNLVQHYALANPGLAFLLVNNGRDAVRVTPAGSLKERAYQVVGRSLLEKLVPVEAAAGGLRVRGFVSNPQEQRSSRDAQYLFVNGRFVRDQLIGRALTEAYRSMMPSGTYPAAVLFVETPASEVDVNVHPAKTEVRFLHASAVLAFIRDAVAEALTATRPVTAVPGFRSRTVADDETEFEREEFQPGAKQAGRSFVEHAASAPEYERAGPATRAEASVESGPSSSEFQTRHEWREAPDQEPEEPSEQPLTGPVVEEWSVDAGGAAARAAFDTAAVAARVEQGSGSRNEPAHLPGLGHGIKPLGQIRDSYIVATDEEGLLLVDQHVAHERVLFEQFRDGKLARSAGLQPMLIPQAVDLSPAEIEALNAVKEDLESMGVEVTELSGRTVAIKSLPSGLAAGDGVALLKEVLTAVEGDRRSLTPDHLRDSVAATLACKAAIKVNMPLTREKMSWLIDELMKTKNPMTCPHGRPIIMRVGLRDIERGFKRPV